MSSTLLISFPRLHLYPPSVVQANPDAESGGSDSDSDDSSTAPHPLDNVMGEANAAKRRAMYPSLSWTPKVRIRDDVDAGDEGLSNQYDSRKRHKSSTTSAVPSLSSLCVDFLVANFDCIESLGGVDSQARNQISRSLVDKNVLDDSAVAILAGTNIMDEYYGSGGVTSLEIPDGSNVTAPGLKKIITTMFRPHSGVHAVVLGHAGLALTSDVAKEVVRGEEH